MRILLKQVHRKCDKHGCGHYGASRGVRKHNGLDIEAEKGKPVYIPFNGIVTKLGYAYADDLSFRYVEVTSDKYEVRLFYIDPLVRLGQNVFEGDVAGTVQTLKDRYKGITDHVHVELRKNDKLLNPEKFFLEDKI